MAGHVGMCQPGVGLWPLSTQQPANRYIVCALMGIPAEGRALRKAPEPLISGTQTGRLGLGCTGGWLEGGGWTGHFL